jgi:hypothetical protein
MLNGVKWREKKTCLLIDILAISVVREPNDALMKLLFFIQINRTIHRVLCTGNEYFNR